MEQLLNYSLVENRVFEQLFRMVSEIREQVSSLKTNTTPHYYTTAEIKKMLGIGDKLVKKYRDEGLLGFTNIGDKYWYTDTDIQRFMRLERHYFPPFSA